MNRLYYKCRNCNNRTYLPQSFIRAYGYLLEKIPNIVLVSRCHRCGANHHIEIIGLVQTIVSMTPDTSDLDLHGLSIQYVDDIKDRKTVSMSELYSAAKHVLKARTRRH